MPGRAPQNALGWGRDGALLLAVGDAACPRHSPVQATQLLTRLLLCEVGPTWLLERDGERGGGRCAPSLRAEPLPPLPAPSEAALVWKPPTISPAKHLLWSHRAPEALAVGLCCPERGVASPRSPRPCCTCLLQAGASLLPSLCSERFATSTDSYILRDLDDTSVVEDGRKKLNTLAHYKVNLPALLPRSLPGLGGELWSPLQKQDHQKRAGRLHSSVRASGE